MMVIERACVTACPNSGPPESATWTVNADVAATVGVPEIMPVVAFRARPCGNAPATILQVSGAVPPVACTGWL